jgi:Flp pilus assembly protein CpaB
MSQQSGTLSLALRSLADANKSTSEADTGERRGGINTVRFGVNSGK